MIDGHFSKDVDCKKFNDYAKKIDVFKIYILGIGSRCWGTQ